VPKTRKPASPMGPPLGTKQSNEAALP
jgi:hypothetical protein